MKSYCMIAYRQMKKELTQSQKSNASFERKVESCFAIAYRFWATIKRKVSKYQFENDDEEIEFFKIVKPKFTSEIEFYTLLYHCVLFQPTEPFSAVNFWKLEFSRLQKFEEDNQLFLHCYQTERHELVPYYFLRRFYICNNAVTQGLYDAGSQAITNGDHLVAVFQALKRHRHYTEAKLANL